MYMNKKIGLRLKEARLKAGLTQEQLAEYANLSCSLISRLERGKVMVSLEKLVELSELLNIGLEFLLCDLFVNDSESNNPKTTELLSLFNQLPGDYQNYILTNLRYLLSILQHH